MLSKIKETLKIIILFSIGGLAYCGIEIAYRGFTHWTMGVVGGFCFVIIGGLNNYIPWEMKIWKQAIVGSLVITSCELVAGIVLNLFLGLHIWDYSTVPFNILGQICLPFSLLWILLSFVGIFIDDWLRYVLFKEQKPKYYW
mgnify:CR=1 FL=1